MRGVGPLAGDRLVLTRLADCGWRPAQHPEQEKHAPRDETRVRRPAQSRFSRAAEATAGDVGASQTPPPPPPPPPPPADPPPLDPPDDDAEAELADRVEMPDENDAALKALVPAYQPGEASGP